MFCYTCNKEFYGQGVWCKCSQFSFCDNICYNQRPFKDSHRANCEKRRRIDDERKKLAFELEKRTKRSRAAAEQPRDGGKFASVANTDKDEKEEADRIQHNLNVQVNRTVEAIEKKGIELQELKPNWHIKFVAQRTDKYAKKGPIIYETPMKGSTATTQAANNIPEVVFENDEQFHLEETPINASERVGSLKVYCYICNKKIDYVRNSLRCNGKLEDGTNCLEGACHKSCMNLTWDSLSSNTVKEIKSSFYCGNHRKNKEANLESGESGDEGPLDVAPVPTKKRPPILYNASESLKLLLKVETREDPKTRGNFIKEINQYVKENKLGFLEVSTKTKKIRVDALMAPIYGSIPITTPEIGSTKLTPHLKRTIPLAATAAPASPLPVQRNPGPLTASPIAGHSLAGISNQPDQTVGNTSPLSSHSPLEDGRGLVAGPALGTGQGLGAGRALGAGRGLVDQTSRPGPGIQRIERSCQLPAAAHSSRSVEGNTALQTRQATSSRPGFNAPRSTVNSSPPPPPPLLSYCSNAGETNTRTFANLRPLGETDSPPMDELDNNFWDNYDS